MLSTAPTNDDQVKMGSRPRVIPLARIVKMVTIVLAPETVTEIANTIMVMEKASIAGGACTDSGAYVVQPASTPPSANVAMIMHMPWIETIALYVFADKKLECGESSCVRIIIARVPPVANSTSTRI